MRLRPRARHAASGVLLPAPPRSLRPREQALGLLVLASLVLGTATALASAAPVPTQTEAVTFSVELADRPIGPQRASRDRALAGGDDVAGPDPLPECATDVATTHGNGQLPAEALCPLPGHADHKLRPDAARGLVGLAAAYEEWFGTPLCITDSYRSLGSQQALAARKPGLAAVPGTSEHGWGLALDFGCGVEDYATPEHRWMAVNAERFGWGQPDWAKDGGAREEPWHWEYLAAGVPSEQH